MKHLKSCMLIAFLILFVGAGSILHSQPPPEVICPTVANDPCPLVPWVDTLTTYVVLSTGCVVQVSYAVRYCAPFCEVRLDNITALYTADGCEPCDPFLAGTSIQQITDEVLRYILSRNRGTVPCGPFEPVQDVRIYRAKCWHHALVAGRRVFTPCSGCCIIATKVVSTPGISTVNLPNPADVHSTPCHPLHTCALELDCYTGPWLYGIPTP